jgi:hypothetical protein
MSDVWNSKCPKCGNKAYVGFSEVECSHRPCENYKEPPPEPAKAVPEASHVSQQQWDEYYGGGYSGDCGCPDCHPDKGTPPPDASTCPTCPPPDMTGIGSHDCPD